MTEAQDIGEMLHLEHLHTLAVVNAVEARIFAGRSRPLDPADAADAAFIEDLLHVIETDIYRHFQFEEEVLFPRLNDAGLSDVTDMLVEEHATIRAMADEMRSLALSVRTGGPDPAQWAQFRDIAMDFIHAAMFHIQKEEMGVIRTLPVTVGAEAGRAMAADYAARKAETPPSP